MDIPSPLLSAMRAFRASLDDKLYHIEHDTDMDGFASGVITTVALQRMGFDAYPYPVERSKTFVPEKGALFLTDLALSGEPADVAREAAKEGKNVYALDHHPWTNGVEKYLHAYVNPHLIAEVPSPSQWNAGFLAYLTFRERVMDYDWLAAISVYTDRCETEWSRFLIERFGREKVQRAGDMLTAYIATAEDIQELDWILLREVNGIDDVLSREEFRAAEERFESAVAKYVENPQKFAILWDEKKKIAVLETSESYHGINSVVSTRLSFLPELRDWVILVLGKEEDGTVKGSLRCQEWDRRRIHLGEVASELARRFGGRGGGHPMAAGMKIPPDVRTENVAEALYFLL